jgi:hypothetical protein
MKSFFNSRAVPLLMMVAALSGLVLMLLGFREAWLSLNGVVIVLAFVRLFTSLFYR